MLRYLLCANAPETKDNDFTWKDFQARNNNELVANLGNFVNRAVVLTHWDDFFRPLDEPLRALPYAGDDLDVTMRVLDELAQRDGVRLHLPQLWRREDPWKSVT